MKKIHCSLFIVHLIVLGLSVTGCLETTREIPITMTVSATALHFPFSGEKQKITIDSNTNAWELTCDASWITFSSSSGARKGVITVSASSNSTSENLSATITITGTGIPTPLTIPVSIGAAPMLIVTPSTLSFNTTDTPKLLNVASNTNWTVSNSAAWLNIAPMSGTNDGTLTVTATSNTSVEQRAAIVSVSNPDLPQPQTVNVTQSGINPVLQVSPTSLSFVANDSSKTFNVTSNTSWTVSNSAAWLNVSPMSGTNDGTLTVTATSNTSVEHRAATVSVRNPDLPQPQTVNVTQSGIIPILQVSPTSLNFVANDSSKTFNVTSNTSWTVSNSAAWLNVSPMSGTNDGTFTVTATFNTSVEHRAATVSVSNPDLPQPQTVNVTQSGINPDLQVSPTSLNFAANNSSKTFTVTSNISWSVSNSASWLTVAPLTGSGNNTVTVTAADNINNAERNVNLTVNGAGVTSQTVSVSQSGTAPSINIEMVQVLGGTFTMGCTSEQGSDCWDNETPSHSVTLSTFYIGKYEVMQGQWKAIMGTTIRQQRDLANPDWTLYGEGDNYPMYYVSWNDIVGTSGASTVINGITYYANGFIYKLNQMTGIQYRLPTEAEWEFAARGRNSGGFKYSGSNTVGNVAWYDGNSGNSTHPVGTKAANELGIYDMSGNVWEWCSDWYGSYNSSSQNNPTGPSTGSERVLRGGSFGDYARFARVSSHNAGTPDGRSDVLGLRLACSSK